MWRPDRSARGPDRPTYRDIDPLNRVFAEAFTDRYSRDGLVGVRVPQLNPLVWRYAIEDAGDGAMIWRDADGHMVAFNMVHRSGTEGWMGPLAVRPDRQGEGLGSLMVRTGIDWLKSQGATTIGLETMPRTVDNIGFYSRIGLVPGHLTVTLVQDVPRRGLGDPALLSRLGSPEAGIAECRELTEALLPGVDFTREIALTRELGIGDTTLVRESGELVGFALWHSTPLAAGRPKDELRVLKLVARDSTGVRPPARRAADDRGGRARGPHRDPVPDRFRLGLPAPGRPRLPGALDRPADDSRRLSAAGSPPRRGHVQLGDLTSGEASETRCPAPRRPATLHGVYWKLFSGRDPPTSSSRAIPLAHTRPALGPFRKKSER